MPDGPEDQHGDRGDGRDREPDRRQPGRDLAHDAHALVLQVEHGHRDQPQHQRDQRARDPPRDQAQDEDQRQRHEADRERVRVGVRQLGDELAQLVGDGAAHRRHAEQLGQLPHDDRDREAEDEPGHHRLGEEVGDEAEPRHAGGEQEHADGHGQGRRQHQVQRRIAAGQVDDDRRRHDRHRRAGGDLEVAARAEHGVDRHGRERRRQADLGRDARQPRVGERDRHHHDPRGQRGDQVGAQPGARIGPGPRRDRDIPRDERSDPVREPCAVSRSRQPSRRALPGRHAADGHGRPGAAGPA